MADEVFKRLAHLVRFFFHLARAALRAESRRDMEETLRLQGKITRAGVRIWHYQERQELSLATPVQKLVASVANFSHEDFR